ncbi:MAG: tetratricopeptide repeat protein [Treponema sp.]
MRRQNSIFPERGFSFKIVIFFLLLLLCSLGAFAIIYHQKHQNIPSIKEIAEDWESSSYNSVYLKSEMILKNDPFNAEALAFRGFSSYYIYVSEPEEASNIAYLENTIISLRQAMYFLKEKDIGKLSYILGKAYYQKGEYYADLALKYLSIAEASNINFLDIHEFKGMAYLLMGEEEAAISSFTLALKETPSPLLLYILGETYMKILDFQNAKQYFFETISKTKDELLQLKCRYYIGSILLDEGELERAKDEFSAILEKDDMSSDAHYGLGLVLEQQGQVAKARSEWRKALKINPSHEKTREKLKV